MWGDFFDYFERFVICMSPIIIAWSGIQSNKNRKQQEKYIKTQEDLKNANDKIKAKEKQELQEHFDKLDTSISTLTQKVEKLEQSIEKIAEIDKRINSLVEMSNINFEFCTSLSAVITSIGNALESSDAIESGTLLSDLTAHKKNELGLIGRMCKIVY